ncbi:MULTISPECIES: outer membrane beta-barrel protein [Stenotrophomonas]|uniref:outer membrane beta-barrel protein n=1 Tax=Stenotrophomonas TaxID=40323 RepID=UPI00131357F0|nr:outer membrane beta-barrel protein [Stenotrophomonas maltophilia]MDG2507228.1 outer membrane beta-barrel protein [Stenotrophomonas maltophilia]HDS1630661.1 porin family protein [Stenotrophomonas maltophilia]
MFNKKTVAPLLAALALATAPIAAQAADHEGFYAFGGIGATGIEGELSTKEKSVKQNDTVSSLQAGAGYRWNRHLAVEVEAHSTLGKADLLELGKVSSYGMRGAVVGIVPLGDRFELVGKLYVGNERSHWREGSVKPYWVKTNEINVGVGVGARYWFNDAMALRLDLDNLGKSDYRAGPSKGELKVSAINLGLQYQF